MAKDQKTIEKVVKELFDSLGIKDLFEVTEGEETTEIVISSDDPGLLIGHHGDTLDSLQLILSLAIAKKLGEYKRITLEVADYKKNREDYLRNLAEQTRDRVISEQREIFLPNLKSWERRIVHLFLQEDSGVVSESVGEGRERTLVVKPR